MVAKQHRPVERETSTYDEVLARVLDRGIVIDVDLRISVAGLSLVGVDARYVVASIDTYQERGQELSGIGAPPSWLFPHELQSSPHEREDVDLPHRFQGLGEDVDPH